MVHLFILFFLALFSTAQADEAKAPGGLPIFISFGVVHSVSLSDGTLGGSAFIYGIRTAVTWGKSGWTSIEDFGFNTETSKFRPCPRWTGDLSREVTPAGLRLGLTYGFKFTPSFDDVDSSFSLSTGPALSKIVKGVGGVAIVVPFVYDPRNKILLTGISFGWAVRLTAESPVTPSK